MLYVTLDWAVDKAVLSFGTSNVEAVSLKVGQIIIACHLPDDRDNYMYVLRFDSWGPFDLSI